MLELCQILKASRKRNGSEVAIQNRPTRQIGRHSYILGLEIPVLDENKCTYISRKVSFFFNANGMGLPHMVDRQ